MLQRIQEPPMGGEAVSRRGASFRGGTSFAIPRYALPQPVGRGYELAANITNGFGKLVIPCYAGSSGGRHNEEERNSQEFVVLAASEGRAAVRKTSHASRRDSIRKTAAPRKMRNVGCVDSRDVRNHRSDRYRRGLTAYPLTQLICLAAACICACQSYDL